jgi:imidazolonepropionase-like amidohydrolase
MTHALHRRLLPGLAILALVAWTAPSPLAEQAAPRSAPAPVHGKAVNRLIIRHAMVIYGNGKPAFGPTDILIQDGLIARVGNLSREQADAEIDGRGKYVMPGIVNAHGHLQDERGGVPQPFQYEMDLYTACGVTTFRDVGSDFTKAKQWRAQSAAHEIVAPKLLLYPMQQWRTKGNTPDALRQGVQMIKEQGADGMKIAGNIDRDQLEAVMDEAHKQGLKVAAHIAVEETTAKDYVDLGVTSIEHFYGVPDAALDGLQDFPADMNYSNEIMRFGRSGELYTQANLNPKKLSALLDEMVAKHVYWDPTFSIYSAGRDLLRAQNLPWYKDYLHPVMEEYWKPDFSHHGSFFMGWTNTEQARWARDYRVWMDTVRDFANRGGVVTTGDDAGFIYSLYGFGLIRELEMQEEAGFSPLEVIQHATVNGAKLVGQADRIGRVRQGFVADLLVVNGNPLENLSLLNPYGTDVMTQNGKPISNYAPVDPTDKSIKNVHGGGIEWTIKDGIPYHVPTIMKEVKDMVAKARAERAHTTSQGAK